MDPRLEKVRSVGAKSERRDSGDLGGRPKGVNFPGGKFAPQREEHDFPQRGEFPKKLLFSRGGFPRERGTSPKLSTRDDQSHGLSTRDDQSIGRGRGPWYT